MKKYASQAARDAQRTGYGSERYWDYLERDALRKRDYWLARGYEQRATAMLTRSLSEALHRPSGYVEL